MKHLSSAFLIGIIFIGLTMPIAQTAKAAPKTITVPDDYPTIQAAVGNASSEDIVHVKNGFYPEHIVVERPLSLIGEDKQTTIVDGSGTGTVVQISSSDVMIANFTIRNAGTSQWFGNGFPDSGVNVEESANVAIRNNIVTKATVGIWSYASTNMSASENLVSNTTTMGVVIYTGANSTIADNLLQNCGIVGLHLDGNTLHSKIENNTIGRCGEGIDIERSAENTVEQNKLLNNNASLVFFESSGNSAQYNTIENNSVGIVLIQSNGNTFGHNSLIDNARQVASDFSASPPSKAISVNTWDDSEECNYWGDYKLKYPNASEGDRSGVWNTPYVIDSNNTDHFPLMHEADISNVAPTPEPSPSIPEFSAWAVLSLAFACFFSATAISWRIRRKNS